MTSDALARALNRLLPTSTHRPTRLMTAAPVRQELRHKCVLIARFHRKWRQCQRDHKSRVIAE